MVYWIVLPNVPGIISAWGKFSTQKQECEQTMIFVIHRIQKLGEIYEMLYLSGTKGTAVLPTLLDPLLHSVSQGT